MRLYFRILIKLLKYLSQRRNYTVIREVQELDMGRQQSLIAYTSIIALCTAYVAAGDTHRGVRPAPTNARRFITEEVDWNELAKNSLRRALDLQLNTNVAKNVILFLGDGMGVTTVTAGRIYSGQLRGESGEEAQLSFDKFPHVALSKTYNVDYQVPDSAGTAIAFLCGVKANSGVIGVTQRVIEGNCSTMSEENKAKSILHWSLEEGKRVGVVTTTRVTHATPASAYAHSPHRDWEADSNVPIEDRDNPLCEDIALQLVTRNIDINVILGGGRQKFLPNTTFDPEYIGTRGQRIDERNLIEIWLNESNARDRRAAYVWNLTEFNNVNPETTDYLLGLFEPSNMKYSIDNHLDPAGEPSLADMTEKAIRILRKENNGYFLLVEGGRIDHAHHDTNAKRSLHDVVAFDEAVERALNLTSTNDTLIVVTADHSHTFSIGGYPVRGNPILGLSGNFGLDELPFQTLGYANGIRGIQSNQTGRHDLTEEDTEHVDFRQPSLVPLNSETHGAEDVAVYAMGPMSHLFHGTQEQNYIAHAMAYASCVGVHKEHCVLTSTTTSETASTPNFTTVTSNPSASVLLLYNFALISGMLWICLIV